MFTDHPVFRLRFRLFLRCRGYSRPLAEEMAGSIDWATILAAIEKWGPILLGVLLALLPLLMFGPDMEVDNPDEFNAAFDHEVDANCG
jgi:hypothetical protein